MLNFRTKHHAGLRGSARKDMQYRAWVDAGDGSSPRLCLVLDVSKTGARIAVENPTDIPDEFTLLLTGGGSVRRQCRVARRANGEIGVQFTNGAAPASAAAPAPAAEPAPEAAPAPAPEPAPAVAPAK